MVPTGRGKPEGSSEAQAEDMRDDDDKDFTDFDVFAFTKSKNLLERGVVEEDASPGGVRCYTRLKKVQSKSEVIALPRVGRRLRRLTGAAKSKDDCSGSDGLEASKYKGFHMLVVGCSEMSDCSLYCSMSRIWIDH